MAEEKTRKSQMGWSERSLLEGFVVKVFVVICNPDNTEGNGHDVDHSYHLTEREALIASVGVGAMGQDGRVESRLVLSVCNGEHYYELPRRITIARYDPGSEEKIRAKVLAKLTRSEQAVLTC